MIFEGIILLLFGYITFKVYPSTLLILNWLFVGFGVFLKYAGSTNGLFVAACIFFVISLSITAMVTEGDFY